MKAKVIDLRTPERCRNGLLGPPEVSIAHSVRKHESGGGKWSWKVAQNATDRCRHGYVPDLAIL
jgi:hypothetical protein